MALMNGAVAQNAVALIKSDTTEIRALALYVGGAGDVAVQTAGGQTVTFSGMAAGTILPVECRKLMSTNTTATLVIGLY